MTDRELLELAAKAARYEIEESYVGGEMKLFRKGELIHWNPLERDGDALRLAVRLGTEVNRVNSMAKTLCWYGRHEVIVQFDHECANDSYASTRRAIVRAAAEIGKGM